MSWKAVSMPKRVAALPRDHRGYPINSVAEWSSGVYSIKPDKQYGWNRMACTSEVGVGDPDLGKVCPEATWRCMAERRCGVCGRRIPTTSIAYFFGHLDNPTYSEPPLHRDCAAYASQVCPGVGVQRDRDTGVWAARQFRLGAMLARVVELADVEGVEPMETVGVYGLDSPELVAAFSPPYTVSRLIATPIGGIKLPMKEFVALLPASMRAPHSD